MRGMISIINTDLGAEGLADTTTTKLTTVASLLHRLVILEK